MARRTKRQRIIAHLKSAENFYDKADAHLAAATALYYEGGYSEGAVLDQIRKGPAMAKKATEMFRRQFA